MSFLMRQVAHCDVCGHEWIVIADKTPSHCAGSKCKSRKWNKGAQPETKHPLELEKVPILAGWRKRTEHAKTCKCLMCKPPK